MAFSICVHRPDGTSRAIWDKAFAPIFREHGVMPVRASRVEAILEGEFRGFFQVDFSLLADETGDPAHRVCLTTPFETHKEATEAEVAWLLKNWVAAP